MDSEELINLLHHSDPVKVELNGLENEVGDVNTAPSATFLHICSGARSFELTGPSKRMKVERVEPKREGE
ncbi:hypothetical protein ACFX1Q_040793 [Malus domestica]